MSDVIRQHLAAISASLKLAQAQIDAAQFALGMHQTVKVENKSARAPQCEGVPSSHCGLENEDARIVRGSFGHPDAWKCQGCGVQSNLTPSLAMKS